MCLGDTLGSFVYVPCEVIKQRMQVQGTLTSWSSAALNNGITVKPGAQLYDYYTGIFHAGYSIWKTQGVKGLYAGYTLETSISFDVILSYPIHCYLRLSFSLDRVLGSTTLINL